MAPGWSSYPSASAWVLSDHCLSIVWVLSYDTRISVGAVGSLCTVSWASPYHNPTLLLPFPYHSPIIPVPFRHPLSTTLTQYFVLPTTHIRPGFSRVSAGIAADIMRSLFGCCSDFPWGDPAHSRAKSEQLAAQTRHNPGVVPDSLCTITLEKILATNCGWKYHQGHFW